LVEEQGRLVGLVTVKDLLRFTEHSSGEDDHGNGLASVLEEGYEWASSWTDHGLAWGRRTFRSR
jgi:chloride channel 3/4/5